MRLVLALTLLLTPSALLAGQRAVFTAKDDPKTLTVTLADNGDARIEGTGEKEYGLRIGGIFYLVTRNDDGVTVARASDLPAAVKKAIPAEMRQLFGKLGGQAPKSSLKITPKGEKTINGRTGKLYEISGLGGDGKPGEFVMSDDPALKPYGENISSYIAAITAPATAMFGPMMDGILADMHKVFALGTPLDADGKFILTKVETVETKAADFDLPAAPLSVDALAASFAEPKQDATPALEDDAMTAPDEEPMVETEDSAAALDEAAQAAADAAEAAADAADAAESAEEAAPNPI